MKENGTLGWVMIMTRRVQAHGRAKCTTIEYRTLDGSQGQLVEYRAHGGAACMTEENGL